MVAVTAEDIAALRSILTGDLEPLDRLHDRLPESGSPPGLKVLLVSALRDAAERRFGRTWSGADLVSYVARVRARDPSRAGAIDPLTAERVLRGALGDGEAVAGLSSDQFARTFVELLIELIIDEQQAGTGLDEFLDRAIRRSERYPY